MTATQLKGRAKDREAAELAPENSPFFRNFRRASFAQAQTSALSYGNAVHSVMQHLRFELCTDRGAIQREIDRLCDEKFITPDQASLVDAQMIADLFATELGRKIRKAENLLREFKFSILESSDQLMPGLEGEQVLLQGVVDCAVIEPDGITVVDFKTDRVTDETLPGVAEGYSLQVRAYAHALRRIYGLPIKSAWLYFFRLGRFVQVDM